jgi:hypothetical protein
MPTPLTLIYDTFEAASGARDALLDAGFDTASIGLDVHADEAGPAEGNFILGNGRDTTRGVADPTAYQPYDRNFRHGTPRRTTLMTVATADDRRRDEAAAIATRYGGRPPA